MDEGRMEVQKEGRANEGTNGLREGGRRRRRRRRRRRSESRH